MSPAVPPKELRPITMLLIDDAPDLRMVVRDALERDGVFAVVGEASEGAEGVDLAQRLQPDMVLLDVAMPGMDGVSALPLLREVAPDAKIVVLTGLARAPLERELRARGAVGFLEKGIPARKLVTELCTMGGLLAAVEVALKEVRTALPQDARSAAAARGTVRRALQEWRIDPEAVDGVALLVSELVTNAVLHGGPRLEVALLLMSQCLRVEVSDAGQAGPEIAPVDAAAIDESGRGLAIVEALSDRWGAEEHAAGKVVWFEIERAHLALDGPLIQ